MLEASCYSGAGNRFILLDLRAAGLPGSPSELARAICAFEQGETNLRETDPAIDGVIFILQPEAEGEVKMVIYNADGSRPEVCGNGLRCLGLWSSESGYREARGLRVETDAGLRRLQFENTDSAGLLVHVNMGPVWVADSAETLSVLGEELKLTAASVGNPHAVLLVDDLVEARVEELGAALQVHERFPEGVNVHFTRVDLDEISVRVYERGVGETLACGSGACAVAGVLRFHGGMNWPIRVRMSGGVLSVQQDDDSGVWLSGPVRREEVSVRVTELLKRVVQQA